MDTRFAVIVLNYRTAKLTIGCLESMENEIEDDMLVLVVDNNSNDGSCEIISDRIEQSHWGGWCRIIPSAANNGFAAGNNIGIRAVEADAYLLLNSDTIIRPGAFKEFRRALEQNPEAGLIAPGMENIDGSIEHNTFRYLTPISEFIRAADTGPISSLLNGFDTVIKPGHKPFEPHWVGFACVVIRRQVIDDIGLLDESFFMYYEDIDYCRRVRKKGWKILYWPESRVVHLLGRSSGVTGESNLHARRPRYYYEARSHYFKTYYGVRGLLAANVLWTAGRLISFLREKVGNKRRRVSEHESRDIWIGFKNKNF